MESTSSARKARLSISQRAWSCQRLGRVLGFFWFGGGSIKPVSAHLSTNNKAINLVDLRSFTLPAPATCEASLHPTSIGVLPGFLIPKVLQVLL